MKKEKMNSLEASLLRQKAEEKLSKKHPLKKSEKTGADTLKLLHELEVYKIELEMQHDELQISKRNSILATDKYSLFYDFAYTGFFTLSPESKIVEMNITGANMLGMERSGMLNRNFRQFVTIGYIYLFDEFIRKVFSTHVKEYCELRLLTKGNQAIFAYVEGIISGDGKTAHITVVNISKRKRAEEILNLKTTEIEQFNDILLMGEKRIIELKKEINQLLQKLGEKEKFDLAE
jgi:PAS domain S-box-containing protein